MLRRWRIQSQVWGTRGPSRWVIGCVVPLESNIWGQRRCSCASRASFRVWRLSTNTRVFSPRFLAERKVNDYNGYGSPYPPSLFFPLWPLTNNKGIYRSVPSSCNADATTPTSQTLIIEHCSKRDI